MVTALPNVNELIGQVTHTCSCKASQTPNNGPVTTKQPAVTTKKPAVTTKQPAAPTTEVVSITKPPIIAYKTCAAVYEKSDCTSEISSVSSPSADDGVFPSAILDRLDDFKCVKVN